ncbi:hypothetical protein E5288_WYG000129 [Bos mutus]|uniref:Uncharacterized protein n=1 Tax=Bos mutus TaxID=72004 RepID=A0A6B0RJ91_9CETA|nr:hypothetical protein [Bos mutus]
MPGRSGAVSVALGCGSDPRHHLPGWHPAAPAFEESRGEDPPVCPAWQAFCSCDAYDCLPASWPTPGSASFLSASLVGGSHSPAVSNRVVQLPGTPWGSPGVPVGSCPPAARAHSSLTLAFTVPPAVHLKPALYKDQPSLPSDELRSQCRISLAGHGSLVPSEAHVSPGGTPVGSSMFSGSQRCLPAIFRSVSPFLGLQSLRADLGGVS